MAFNPFLSPKTLIQRLSKANSAKYFRITMTTSTVRTHLIQEIIDNLRVRGNGYAMTCLGLSGTNAFNAFKQNVGDHVVARANWDIVRKRILFNFYCYPNESPEEPPRMINFSSATELQNGILQYIRKLQLCIDFVKDLPTVLWNGNITELIIEGETDDSFVPLFDRCPNVEILKVERTPGIFINEIRSGKLKLQKLKRLECGVSPRWLSEMLTNPKFPFPEDVTLYCDFTTMIMIGLDPAQIFPQVKHLNLHLAVYAVELDWLHETFLSIVGCFPSVDVVKCWLTADYGLLEVERINIKQFCEWVGKTKFTVPVEISFAERADISWQTPTPPVNMFNDNWPKKASS